jgi:hypothetical protein
VWRTLGLAITAASLVAASPAAAATSLVLDTPGRAAPAKYRRWVAGSGVPTPPVPITLHLRICPGAPGWAVGCAVAANREVYLDAGGDSRHALMHEIGHLFDFGEMSEPLRDAFRVILHRHGEWAGAAANNPLQEKFAEAYSLCSRHRAIRSIYFAQYAYTPTPAQHAGACAVIRRAAASPWHLESAAAPPVVYMAANGCLGVWRYVDRAGWLTARYSCLASLIRMTSWDYAPGARPAQVCG